MTASNKATTPPPAVIRTPDLVFEKVTELLKRFHDLDHEPKRPQMMMDRWTHENFMRQRRVAYNLTMKDGQYVWAGLELQYYYQAPVETALRPAQYDEVPTSYAYSRDDEPFLLSIRYTKESNGRILYLDDPDLHPFWT